MKNLMKHSLVLSVLIILILVPGCLKDKVSVPKVVSVNVANVTSTTATSGGSIIDAGSSSVTASGVCWSTSETPTINDSKTTDGPGIGKFFTAINGLIPGTTYFLRSYATNSSGTSYGSEESFVTSLTGNVIKDIDGNLYSTITIGSQVWMRDNLKTTRYSNGDLIGTMPPAEIHSSIFSDPSPEYQWAYDGNESLVARYGRLYTWFAATDVRNVCPTGWHLPSDSEWTIMEDYLVENGYGGHGQLNELAKSLSEKTDWIISYVTGSPSDDISGNNSSGFSALPSGVRDAFGNFNSLGKYCTWWTSTIEGGQLAFQRDIHYLGNSLVRDFVQGQYGFSIRCLKD